MSNTIKDVAKLAGVSISTVSRVMNDSKPVSPESRRKVLDAIKKLDFKPNELARSLVKKESKIIGVIVKDINISYMASIIQGIEETGKLYKYDILLTNTYGEKNSELDAVELFYRKRVDGLIVVSEDIDTLILEKINDYKIPYMLIDRYYDPEKINTVSVDYKSGSEKMSKHLLELGHKKIIYLRSNGNSPVENMKFNGFKNYIMKNDYPLYVLDVDNDKIRSGYSIGDTVFEMIKKHNITAVFCGRDKLAIGLINYFYDNNIRVPYDISVVGYGGHPFSKIYRPTITTINEPYFDIGAVAIRRLVKVLLKEEVDTKTLYLPVELIKRQSSIKNSKL